MPKMIRKREKELNSKKVLKYRIIQKSPIARIASVYMIRLMTRVTDITAEGILS